MVGPLSSESVGADSDSEDSEGSEMYVDENQIIAFLCATHPRLGALSDLRLLPPPVLRHIAQIAYWPRFDARFQDPDGPHRMGEDRREIGWSVDVHRRGFVAVTVRDPILPRHGVVAVELAYTAIDDGAVVRVGGASLCFEEDVAVDDDDDDAAAGFEVPVTYARLDGFHVPALDNIWHMQKRIVVDIDVDMTRGTVEFAVDGVPVGRAASLGADWRQGVRISAEDHSDGAPLHGDTEWRATIRSKVPKRRRRLGSGAAAQAPPYAICAAPDCFCRRIPRYA